MAEDDKFAVTDPTDWTKTATPSLALVDSTLRCQVCKDFFDAAVITACTHTFCSKCIRRAIAVDGKCPACRSTTQEHTLRRNVAIQELVHAFEIARPEVLKVALDATHTTDSDRRGSKRKRAEVEPEAAVSSRTIRSQAKRTRHSSHDESDPILIGDSDDDKDPAFMPEAPPQKTNDGLVPCPICDKRMKEEAVFIHLDSCSAEPSNSTSQSKVRSSLRSIAPQSTFRPIKPPEKLAQLNYSLIKEKDMRKILIDLGVPSLGSKEQMVKRYKEWVTLCNSNLDSKSPRSKRDLLADLTVWERTMGSNASARNAMAASADVMSKDFDAARWAKQNKSEFDDLIASARRARVKAKEDAEKAAASDTAGETKRAQAAGDGTSLGNNAEETATSAQAQDQDTQMEGVEQNDQPSAERPNVDSQAVDDMSTERAMDSEQAPVSSQQRPDYEEQQPPPSSQQQRLPKVSTAITPHAPKLPSLSPIGYQRHNTDTSRISYRRPSTSSPVPGFSLPGSSTLNNSLPSIATDRSSEHPHAVSRLPPKEWSPTKLQSSQGTLIPSLGRERSLGGTETSLPSLFAPIAAENGDSVRKVPMFEVPEQPLMDADVGGTR